MAERPRTATSQAREKLHDWMLTLQRPGIQPPGAQQVAWKLLGCADGVRRTAEAAAWEIVGQYREPSDPACQFYLRVIQHLVDRTELAIAGEPPVEERPFTPARAW